MYKVAGLILAIIGLTARLEAQVLNTTELCSGGKKKMFGATAKLTVATPEEDQYDVKYVKLDISLTNESTEVSGNVTTRAAVVASVMTVYCFELAEVLTVDSVKINGELRPVENSGVVRRVSLPHPLPQNHTFTAQVFYHGTATPGNIFGKSGLNNDSAGGTRVTFTLSEPYKAREWWPCKQSLQDKIDSADIWITIPEGLKAGSNGLLQTTTPMPGNRRRYLWKTRYPIAYYLISASVAPYKEYSFYTKLTANDSVLIQNYIYQDPEFLSQNQRAIDSVGIMMQFMSALFGDYPFKKEKYGHCIAPFFGGMEHQTMTTQGDFGSNLTVHELGHQWFGNNVTCATWKDVWLNEGFASYCEYLFKERYRTKEEALEHMAVFHSRALDAPFAAVYVDDTTNPERIFDGNLSYSKAAAVIHTLRFVIDDEALFFNLLRAYQAQFASGNATTEDFKQLAEDMTGMDLTSFFNQWIYKQGHPVFDVKWNQVFDKVFIEINQRGAAPLSNNLFETPLELKLLSYTGDTTVRIYLDRSTQLYRFNWGERMVGVSIDPEHKVLNQAEQVRKDGELGLYEVTSDRVIAFPSSTRGDWYLVGLNSAYDLVLTDMSGRIVWQGNNGSNIAQTIPSSSLACGMYFLRILSGKQEIEIFKLVKE